ncbi:UDP-glucose/GDP-mannose dehydrogenase family protein [Streptomyces sp. APSN-46.1]|uniref:UDP-glucose dehydrogenase family protein n=1 Tax=Streptomyces sp. APSN-46.1 TaxID=2929049 RepID=UPI001FB4920E|nr:UDP-glucose/GDP-mannose dehydrogenase family protein [Streptomyces sp. APSN-46.1]MCJ1677926.1 UDP-glucose/GDP-mannose dehydrogenase family protein [Streptomyces sp. APSN-46.1]
MPKPYRMTVIGSGYLGITHAACMAEAGHHVLALDIDAEKVARLNKAELPIHEKDLGDLLKRGVASGRLRFTTSYEEAGAFGDVHFLCLGTPQRSDGFAADLSQLDAAVDSLAPHLVRECLVVGKSTVPVGTAERLATRIARKAPAGTGAELAWNPEFLREGFAVADTLRPDRIVLGVRSEHAERTLRDVYAPLGGEIPYVVTDFATAELVKSAANAFLATKISYINAMAEVCESAGADVVRLAEALGLDERIGGRFLRPGLGFGGGCLPKDIRALWTRAEELGAGQALGFLREVDAINLRRRERVVELARELVGGTLDGRKVAVLGAAFKPDSDDIRDSPALAVAAALERQGAVVSVHDPVALDHVRKAYPLLNCAASASAAAQDAQVVLLLTEWRQYAELDPEDLVAAVAERRIVDARHALDGDRWRASGWEYRAMGRP